MAINALFYDNGIPMGTGFLEISGDDEADGLFIPLQTTAINGNFHGPLGILTIAQTFRFSRMVIDRPVEAIYRFPLPGDAAVTEVVATFGDETVRTRLTERASAEKEYDDAFKKGKRAILITRESDDVFTLHLTGIPPDTDVVVQTTVAMLARAVPNGWEMRLPVTIAPRYTRSDENHYGVQANPMLSVIDPGYCVSMDLSLHPAAEIISYPPEARVTRTDEMTGIRIESTRPDHDLVIRWAAAAGGEWLTSWAANDPDGSYTYLLSLITPVGEESGQRIPREVILVADQSGSMQGKKWNAAAKSILSFLDGLGPDEYFNLCLFSNESIWFSPSGPVPATLETIESAKTFLKTISLFGGTELGVALEQALHQPHQTGQYSRHVLVVTDGQVTDESRLFRLVEAESAKPSSRRMSVISIDTAPNAHLALELARIGGGTAKFLTDEGDVESALRELLASWQPPILSNTYLSVDKPGIEVTDYRILPISENRVIDVGDLCPEKPIFLCYRIPFTDQTPMLTLTESDGETIVKTSACPDDSDLFIALKVVFGAGRLRALEYLNNAWYSERDLAERLKKIGYTVPKFETTLYPENNIVALNNYLKQFIIEESLRYGIPSSHTAFIGVSDKEGKVPSVTVAVPNAIPGGWNEMDLYSCCQCAPRRSYFSDSMHSPMIARNTQSIPLLRPATMSFMIQPLEVENGEAILIESHHIQKGRYAIILTCPEELHKAGVSIKVFLDGKEIGSWTETTIHTGDLKIAFPITVPHEGILRAVVIDPSGAWNGKVIEVTLRKMSY